MLQYCQCIYVSLAHVHACFLMPWIASLFLYSTSLLTQAILPQKNWVCSPACSKSPANIWESCIAVFLDFWFYNSPGIPITGWLIPLSWNILSLDWSFWFLQSPSCLNCYSPIYKHCLVCVSHFHVAVSGAYTTIGSDCFPDNAPTTIPSHVTTAGNNFTTFIFLHNT